MYIILFVTYDSMKKIKIKIILIIKDKKKLSPAVTEDYDLEKHTPPRSHTFEIKRLGKFSVKIRVSEIFVCVCGKLEKLIFIICNVKILFIFS
jgi:hypothetical protein